MTTLCCTYFVGECTLTLLFIAIDRVVLGNMLSEYVSCIA